MRDLSDEDIEEEARRARVCAGIDRQSYPDLMTVIFAFKRKFPPFNYIRKSIGDMPASEASWDADKKLLSIRHDTFRGMNSNVARARNTIAEEFGHFWLNHDGVLNRSTIPNIAEKAVARIRLQERQAKRFAPAFLAPARLIDLAGSVEDIMDRFVLSKASAEIRLSEVQRLYRRKNKIERPLPLFVEELLRKLDGKE